MSMFPLKQRLFSSTCTAVVSHQRDTPPEHLVRKTFNTRRPVGVISTIGSDTTVGSRGDSQGDRPHWA
ncbi:hypothetical protein A2U01_0010569 [Trifolium medium]|uniref:Uncharacterized protein n=1 Tax=Trifolium medium TaxID=97028 RepID=A0A392MRM4_9FABA|nr:hypothetical protein [Trifolium medium]